MSEELIKSVNQLTTSVTGLTVKVEENMENQRKTNQHNSEMIEKLFDKIEVINKEVFTMKGQLKSTWIAGGCVSVLLIVIGFIFK